MYVHNACCYGYTMQARDDDRNGFMELAQTKGNVSLVLNITAAVVVAMSWIAFITVIIVQVSRAVGTSLHHQ